MQNLWCFFYLWVLTEGSILPPWFGKGQVFSMGKIIPLNLNLKDTVKGSWGYGGRGGITFVWARCVCVCVCVCVCLCVSVHRLIHSRHLGSPGPEIVYVQKQILSLGRLEFHTHAADPMFSSIDHIVAFHWFSNRVVTIAYSYHPLDCLALPFLLRTQGRHLRNCPDLKR